MTTYYRNTLDPYLKELETYFHALKRAVEGHPPNTDIAHLYHETPDHFKERYRDVDYDRILREIGHFKVAVESLKQLKTKSAEKQGRKKK